MTKRPPCVPCADALVKWHCTVSGGRLILRRTAKSSQFRGLTMYAKLRSQRGAEGAYAPHEDAAVRAEGERHRTRDDFRVFAKVGERGERQAPVGDLAKSKRRATTCNRSREYTRAATNGWKEYVPTHRPPEVRAHEIVPPLRRPQALRPASERAARRHAEVGVRARRASIVKASDAVASEASRAPPERRQMAEQRIADVGSSASASSGSTRSPARSRLRAGAQARCPRVLRSVARPRGCCRRAAATAAGVRALSLEPVRHSLEAYI